MKIAVLYHSLSGNTKSIGEIIAKGAQEVSEDIETKVISIEDMSDEDIDFVNSSKAVIVGTPTYYANMTWQMKKWLDTAKCQLCGKLGAAFATCNQFGGGSEIAVNTLNQHLICKGMLVYTGGTSLKAPYIHAGAVCIKDGDEAQKKRAEILGQRIAQKALELFK